MSVRAEILAAWALAKTDAARLEVLEEISTALDDAWALALVAREGRGELRREDDEDRRLTRSWVAGLRRLLDEQTAACGDPNVVRAPGEPPFLFTIAALLSDVLTRWHRRRSS